MHLIRHTLMTRGHERAIRLIEIASLIHKGDELLVGAELYNSKDKHTIRRKWIHHEIDSLESKFVRARFWAKHLPNLYLAQDLFKFTLNASVQVVEFAVGLPVAVGLAIGAAAKEALHLVARAFRFMGAVLLWTVNEVEEAFIWLAKKVRRSLHAIAEGVSDAVAVVIDIGHHIFQSHHCKRQCKIGLTIGDADKCDCRAAKIQAETVTVTALCVEREDVCSKEEFSAQMSGYDVGLSWTKEDSHLKVKSTVTEINKAITTLSEDLIKVEASTPKFD